MKLSLTAFVSCLFFGVVAEVLKGTNPIVMTPLPGKSGPDKVLIVINGALVPNTNYIDVAKAVQTGSDLNLWVAIPSFLINTPNPRQIDSKIEDAISKLE